MTKPLLGGSAAMFALLSVSLIFNAKPSVAESLELSSSGNQTQQKSDPAVRPEQVSGESTANSANTSVQPVNSSNPTEASNLKGSVERTSVSSGEVKTAEPTTENAEQISPTLSFTATAYSLRGRTASGRYVSRGLIAADRRVLPIGTRVRLEAGPYSGEYLVADTGGAVRGRKIDIWMPSTREAMRFGRRKVKLTVLSRVRPRTGKRV